MARSAVSRDGQAGRQAGRQVGIGLEVSSRVCKGMHTRTGQWQGHGWVGGGGGSRSYAPGARRRTPPAIWRDHPAWSSAARPACCARGRRTPTSASGPDRAAWRTCGGGGEGGGGSPAASPVPVPVPVPDRSAGYGKWNPTLGQLRNLTPWGQYSSWGKRRTRSYSIRAPPPSNTRSGCLPSTSGQKCRRRALKSDVPHFCTWSQKMSRTSSSSSSSSFPFLLPPDLRRGGSSRRRRTASASAHSAVAVIGTREGREGGRRSSRGSSPPPPPPSEEEEVEEVEDQEGGGGGCPGRGQSPQRRQRQPRPRGPGGSRSRSRSPSPSPSPSVPPLPAPCGGAEGVGGRHVMAGRGKEGRRGGEGRHIISQGGARREVRR